MYTEYRPIKVYSKVMVVSSTWDFNYHHFLFETIGRIVRFLPFIKKNPDIKILIRAGEFDGLLNNFTLAQANVTSCPPNYPFCKVVDAFLNITKVDIAHIVSMRNSIFGLLGIERHRIIDGPAIAKTIYIPSYTRFAYSLSNPLDIRLLSKVLVKASMEFRDKANLKSRYRGSVEPVVETFDAMGSGILQSQVKYKAAYQHIYYY